MSSVSGTGIQTLSKLVPRTVNVTAKDASGNLIGSGGDVWIVRVSNECTKANDYYCSTVSGAASVLSGSFSGVMTDNGDGTYSYTYTISTTGRIFY